MRLWQPVYWVWFGCGPTRWRAHHDRALAPGSPQSAGCQVFASRCRAKTMLFRAPTVWWRASPSHRRTVTVAPSPSPSRAGSFAAPSCLLIAPQCGSASSSRASPKAMLFSGTTMFPLRTTVRQQVLRVTIVTTVRQRVLSAAIVTVAGSIDSLALPEPELFHRSTAWTWASWPYAVRCSHFYRHANGSCKKSGNVCHPPRPSGYKCVVVAGRPRPR